MKKYLYIGVPTLCIDDTLLSTNDIASLNSNNDAVISLLEKGLLVEQKPTDKKEKL